MFRKGDIWVTDKEIWKCFRIGTPKEVEIKFLVSKAKILLQQGSKISFLVSENVGRLTMDLSMPVLGNKR